jgi:hypothetical protein
MVHRGPGVCIWVLSALMCRAGTVPASTVLASIVPASGLRKPPLLPLMLTVLSADRARTLPGFPMPGLDKDCFLGFAFGARLGLVVPACVLFCMLSFVISNSPLGEQVRPWPALDKGGNELPLSKAPRLEAEA